MRAETEGPSVSWWLPLCPAKGEAKAAPCWLQEHHTGEHAWTLAEACRREETA